MVNGSSGGRAGRRHRVLLAGALGVLALAGLISAPATAIAVPGTAATGSEADPTGLGDAAAGRGRYFGAAVQPAKLTDPVYARILDQEFSSVTPENALEWDAVEPARNQFAFTASDRVVEYARSIGAAARGRGLVGPSANQVAWLGSLGTTDARSAMTNHITVTVRHFNGRIGTWDVVSEAFLDDGRVRPSVFADRANPQVDYLESAFRAARAADPGARLCYNDYGIEDLTRPKAQAVLGLVRNFRARGVPIDCVGLEGHFSTPAEVPANLRQTIATYAGLGVNVEITELDIGTSSTGLSQSEAYRRVVSACVSVPRCTGITVWGVRDSDSWRANLAPLLFDSTGARKPAYHGARSGLGVCVPVGLAGAGLSCSPPPPTATPVSSAAG